MKGPMTEQERAQALANEIEGLWIDTRVPLLTAALTESAERERQSIIDQLQNPDEAMVEAVRAVWDATTYRCEGDELRICRALASVLSTPSDGEEG